MKNVYNCFIENLKTTFVTATSFLLKLYRTFFILDFGDNTGTIPIKGQLSKNFDKFPQGTGDVFSFQESRLYSPLTLYHFHLDKNHDHFDAGLNRGQEKIITVSYFPFLQYGHPSTFMTVLIGKTKKTQKQETKKTCNNFFLKIFNLLRP